MSSPESVRTVSTPAAYAESFLKHQPVVIPESSKLLGRIIRGKQPTDFSRLSADGRKLAFTMGNDGLTMLPGKPLLDALAAIGLMPEYIQGRIDQGYAFKLAVFEAEHSGPATLATWENVLREVGACYPELEADIATHGMALKDQKLPEDIDVIDLAGPNHPSYMSWDRYRALPSEQRKESPLPLRKLLRHEVHLGPLFSGDGHTLTHDGQQGMTEHIVPNALISLLKNAVMLDLPLSHSQ